MISHRFKRSHNRLYAGVLGALVLAGGCSSASRRPANVISNQPPGVTLGKPMPTRPIAQADVDFMTGMIDHHAQAIVMARWCPTHGASASLRILCERIIVAQGDEIKLMSTWLSDHGKPVPQDPVVHAGMTGMNHMLMPGMLTDEQMKQLDAARDAEFDRLFLTFMIQHHQGAIAMVDTLFKSYGAGQDDLVYKVASDVWADQMAEIERMQKMLAANGNEPRP
jgi:uncharacterized protein (DUF305 family)